MNVLGIIPARYASSRFPAKALADINGKPMIQRVYERALQANLSDVVVATDANEIANVVQGFGGNVILTSTSHTCGTDRCIEVVEQYERHTDIVLNIQGDEPFLDPRQLAELVDLFEEGVDIATLARPTAEADEINNPNVPKVVFDQRGFALYFSRSPIPYRRDKQEDYTYYKHVGLYAFRSNALLALKHLESTPLEQAEKLEQLKWLEKGLHIKVGITAYPSYGIDVPADIENIPLHFLRDE